MKFSARDGSSARTLATIASSSSASTAVAAGSATETPMEGSGPRSGPATQDATAPQGGVAHPAASRAGSRTFSKGHRIFGPNEGRGLIYIVRSGCVRLYKTLPDGRSINLGLLGPNTIFAQEDSYDGLATGAVSEAIVETTVSMVEADDLAGLIAESPDLAAAVVTGMTRRLTELQTLVEQLLLRDTAVRLVTTLLTLAKSFGQATEDGQTLIPLPLTHQALANMIGSNRVTVTRKLLELQHADMVKSLGRNSLVVNLDKLRAYVQAANATT